MSLVLKLKYWIGDKPKVQHKREYYKPVSDFEVSDNLASDPEQNWDDEHELKDNNRNGNR